MPEEFAPVPLPATAADPDLLAHDTVRWATSAPVRHLAAASGWEWPAGSNTEVVSALADLSAEWDFRRRYRESERGGLNKPVAEVRGRRLTRADVVPAARALGLVEATPLADQVFDHTVVLTGMVSACINRTRLAGRLAGAGTKTSTVDVLTGHRVMSGSEVTQAAEYGLGAVVDEADAAVAASRIAFGLGEPERVMTSDPHLFVPVLDEETAAFRGASARYEWPRVTVDVVPSGDPQHRRTNTPDQLAAWSSRTRPGAGTRVLLLTTQIYAPFQHLEAARLLGLPTGCTVVVAGVDATNAYLPLTDFGPDSYLQEIRSALLSAARLLAVLSPG